MSDGVTIEFNSAELEEFFTQLPVHLQKKAFLPALRKGGNEITKSIRRNLPPYLKKFKIAVSQKALKGSMPAILVGIFGRKATYINRRGQKWDPYMLLYWHNYGTLSNRSSSHKFQYSRRKVSADRRGGIRPLLFFEKSVNQSIGLAEDKIAESFQSEFDKFLVKKGFK